MVREYSFYQSAAGAEWAMRYYFDRYYLQTQRVTRRVPLRDFYGVDLFDSVKFEDMALGHRDGTGPYAPIHNNGDDLSFHDDGTPLATWKGGQVFGEVVGIVERGSWMDITIETVNPFQVP